MDETGNKKGQLYADLFPQAGTDEEREKICAFLDGITEKQAAQIIDLYGFTESFQIPIWEADLDGPAKDANREHDTPPDRYIEGQTTPRNVADDLALIIFGESNLEGVKAQIQLTGQLSQTNKQYWEKLGEILGKPEKKLLSVTGKRPQKIDFPVDKVNAKVWKLLEAAPNGQIGIAAEKRDSSKPITILYAINFDALGDNVSITRQLTPFDRRVYLIVSALYNAGNGIISLSQIYRTMTGKNHSPSDHDIEKIADSIAKMAAARVYLNNEQEAKAYRYEKFTYSASLLPMERLDGVINGKTVEAAIHLFREPPLVSFARGRKQITTIERKLLETPVNKTDQNLLIEDYLIERIAHAKTGRQPSKILYETLYAETRINTKKQRQRAASKLGAILGHYVKCGFIKGYTDEGDGIRLDL